MLLAPRAGTLSDPCRWLREPGDLHELLLAPRTSGAAPGSSQPTEQ